MKTSGIELVRGNITELEADAIVNAANNSLLGGGGVDGAIHKAAGPELLDECRELNGCETGDAKITGGYRLKARYVIHTVGPIWYGGDHKEHDLLASCYRKSLALASENMIKSIGFPGISTGAYRFPAEQAAAIAVNETKQFMEKNQYPEKVIFVAFRSEDYEIYRNLLDL